jgi:cytoskeletal protein CcmA (bactofilin family)
MTLPNLTDQNIQDTYQRVLQTDGENIYDGTGSALPLKLDGPDLIVSGAVRAQSYIVSESITVVTSGSTIFGDTTDDTHQFIGNITSSGFITASGAIHTDGNISSSATVIANALDISGNVDVDGTLETDSLTIDGTSIVTVIANTQVNDALHVQVTDNESTDENNLIPFIEDAGTSTGQHGLEMDGDFHYNPSTGTVTATKVATNTIEGSSITLDASGDIELNADGSDIRLKDGAQSFLTLSQPSSHGLLFNTTISCSFMAGSTITGFAKWKFQEVATAPTVEIDAEAGTVSASAKILVREIESADSITLDSAANIVVDSATNIVTLTGNVTSSGTISTSQSIYTPTINGENSILNLTSNVTSSGTFSTSQSVFTPTLIGEGEHTILHVDGMITASSNITSSGGITASSAYFRTDVTASKLSVGSDIIHSDDPNTKVTFGADAITLTAGGTDAVVIGSSGITTLTAGGDLDIGSHELRAQTFESDVSTGTAPFTVASTTQVANLNAATAGTATVATTVTITDNESTNETNAIIFTAGGDIDGGNLGLESDGDLTYNPSSGLLKSTIYEGNRKFSVPTDTAGLHSGDVVYFGGEAETIAAGQIVHYDGDGDWELADADDNTKSDGLLGVALGADASVNGILLRGTVTLDHDPGDIGDVLYLTTTAGDCSVTKPSGNNNIIRVIGYKISSDGEKQIWFNPDSTFIKYTT